MRVVVAAAIRLYREGLAMILGDVDGLDVVATAADPEETVTVARDAHPDVILFDMSMHNGSEALPMVTTGSRPAVVVALAVPSGDVQRLECIEAGVAGFVSREATVAELVDAVQNAHRGEFRCSPQFAGTLVRHVSKLAATRSLDKRFELLTSREAVILDLIQEGLSNKEIARSLHSRVATVKNHVHNLLVKLEVHSRARAAVLARQNGWCRA
jgi:DNA-binding NarL/FixJ family response regulator